MVGNDNTATSARVADGGLRGYLRSSKRLNTSVVLVLPLFVAYQLGVLATGGLRNGVDFVTSALFALFANNLLGYLVFNAAVLAVFALVLVRMKSSGQFRPRLLAWLLLESALYALAFGSVVVLAIRTLGLGALLAAGAPAASMNLLDKIVMSAGAGLYEEIVFRAFLMGGLLWLLQHGLRMPRVVAALCAMLVSSVVFSAIHHIREPFTVSAFTFRIFAGLLFAGLFWTRGLAVAVYTHFLYDVYVMVFRNA